MDGVRARVDGVGAIVHMCDGWSEEVFERAASGIARSLTIRPSRQLASSLLELIFDEGSASQTGGTIGIAGMRSGVAWYAGLLARYRLGLFHPVLEAGMNLVGRPTKGRGEEGHGL
jgi:hypothetical protein